MVNKDEIFLVDCDEILRQTLEGMVELFNSEFPEHKKNIEDIKSFMVEESFPEIKELTGIEASKWFFQDNGKKLFRYGKPFPNIKEDIETLRKYGKVVIVTYQKTYENKRDTLQWLQKQGLDVDGICFVKDKTMIHGDYLIDDNFWNFIGSHVEHGILVDAPYNTPDNLRKLDNKTNCKTINQLKNLHEFVETYVNAQETAKIFEEKHGKKIYTLKKPIISGDELFGKIGEKVRVVDVVIEGLEVYAVVRVELVLGSEKINIKELEDYICLDTEKKCINCRKFAKGILCCVEEMNEGMRVWHPEDTGCDYFEGLTNYE